MQAITTEDIYPTFGLYNLGHNNINMSFDAYLDNVGWKSSYANANFQIAKISNKLAFNYKTGIAVGSAITWSEAMNIDNTGLITANAGISTTTLATSDKITTTLGKPIIMGNTTKGTGATGGLELYGTAANVNGGYIHAFVNTSVYPIFQQLNWNPDNIGSVFDAYFDGTNWKSSYSGSNFMMYKNSNKLSFYNDSGTTAGSNITWTEAMNISNAGVISANSGAKIVVQNSTDGGSSRGIFMTTVNDTAWGIYLSNTAGTTNSLNNGGPPGGYNFTGPAIRFRVWNSSTAGFVWENSAETRLMSLRGSDGQLWVSSNPVQYSDRRLKSDIKECLGLDFINKLNPVCYRMIDDNKKQRAGLIAQDVEILLTGMNMLDFGGFSKEKIMVPCPKQKEECEMKGENLSMYDVKMVDSGEVSYAIGYSEFIAPLIKAVQQLSEKVINLEKENKNLMNILQDQANQLAEIRAVVFPNAN